MAPVWLYVYDLSEGIASVISSFAGFPLVPTIWHSSVVVHNREIEYGRNGISCIDVGSSYLTLVNKYYLGETDLGLKGLEDHLDYLKSTFFKAENYSVLTWNCNIFANYLASVLVHKKIPESFLKITRRGFFSGLEIAYIIGTLNSPSCIASSF